MGRFHSGWSHCSCNGLVLTPVPLTLKKIKSKTCLTTGEKSLSKSCKKVPKSSNKIFQLSFRTANKKLLKLGERKKLRSAEVKGRVKKSNEWVISGGQAEGWMDGWKPKLGYGTATRCQKSFHSNSKKFSIIIKS